MNHRIIPIESGTNHHETRSRRSAHRTQPRLIATLGDSDRTTLRLANFLWLDPKAGVVAIDGEFILDICREGGDRLFSDGARFGVTAHPNPFNTITIIEYSLLESGPTQLYIIDALGRRIATLLDGAQEAGMARVVFDASQFSSGVFHVVLRTTSMTAGTAVFLVK